MKIADIKKIADVKVFLAEMQTHVEELRSQIEEHDAILNVETSVLTVEDQQVIISALVNASQLINGLVSLMNPAFQGPDRATMERECKAAMPTIANALGEAIALVHRIDVIQPEPEADDGDEQQPEA